MLRWLLVLGVFLVTACSSSGGGGSGYTEVPRQINMESSCADWENGYKALNSQLSVCQQQLASRTKDAAFLMQALDEARTEMESARLLKESLERSTLLSRNPTNAVGYDYAACGEKYFSTSSGCQYTVYCTGSMKPVFNCQEKLYFTTKKASIRVGDIVDIKLPQPEYMGTSDGRSILVGRKIHLVVGVEGDYFITARINPGTEGFHQGVKLEDDFKPRKEDVAGVLKGVEW